MRCALVAGCSVLHNELCLPAHAKEHVVVVVATRDLADSLPNAVLIREVEGCASHRGNLAGGNGGLIQRCVVVPACGTTPGQASID